MRDPDAPPRGPCGDGRNANNSAAPSDVPGSPVGRVEPRRGSRLPVGAALALWLAVLALVPGEWAQARSPARLQMTAPEPVAVGIDLFRSTDASALDGTAPGPVQMALVRLDPRKVRLATALANGCAPSRESVIGIAAREGALVALNGGFFSMETGAPTGLLKHRGRWIGAANRARGAVAFPAPAPNRPVRPVFGRVTFSPELRIRRGLRWTGVPVDRLSGTGAQRGLTFSPAPCPASDTNDGTATNDRAATPSAGAAVPARVWTLRGAAGVDREAIAPGFSERHGVSGRWMVDAASAGPPVHAAATERAVLTFRGPALPRALAALRAGQVLTADGRLLAPDARTWRDAPDAVGGAGLLVSRGGLVTDWSAERTDAAFRASRHPRSLIGVDGAGSIWLIAVDGRQPATSVGMSFPELQRLARSLDLRDALNLDGGGSTTLVVRGRIVNRPSDLTGPRAVSDAVVVHAR